MNAKADKEALPTEYEVWLMDASQLDSGIWQLGTVFMGLSIVGFSLLIQTQAKGFSELLIYAVLTIFGLMLLGFGIGSRQAGYV